MAMERIPMSTANPTTPPWLQSALDRADVTDICLNGPSEAYLDSGAGMERVMIEGIGEPSPGGKSLWGQADPAVDMRNWVLQQLALAGKSWDAKHPFVDATLASGHRLHAAFPPLARQGVLISLRRLASAGKKPFSAGLEAETGGETPERQRLRRWQHSPFYVRLAQAVREGDSILIAGATGSGKTTLANDLLSEAPPAERILALEDTPELSPEHPHFISLTSRPPNADGLGEVTLRQLLRQALRMRPDRVILGECRGGEVLDLLQALNTGHRGAMATLHANSPRDALRRIELLCLLAAGGAIPSSAIRELLSVGVNWVAQVRRTSTGRTIESLWKVEGREGDTILMRRIEALC
jgi:pilus assembly protein CpaF